MRVPVFTERSATAWLTLFLSAAVCASQQASPPNSGGHAVAVVESDVKWRPLRPGAEIATISGDPNTAGAPFVIRMRYRGTVRVPPHWHPTDEHITVLRGTFMLGMGERFDESVATALVAGAYLLAPAKMPHFAWSKGDTIVQVHGIGPFAINYVNPADAPAAK